MEREQKTILLVEDEAPARMALQDLIEAHGYRVVAAGGGIEALVMLRDNPPPDLIVSDLVMGLMSGWELNERQQIDYRLQDVPLILVSGVPDLQYHAEALGAAAYFSKPVEAGELLETIDRILFRQPAVA